MEPHASRAHARGCSEPVVALPPMSATETPFDLVEVKLAAPLTRPGTVAKADVIARLCASSCAVRDRGRAGRVRQDDAARAVGRGRSASVRVGRARRRETTTPWCSCATSRPRFTASSRSRPRCSTRCRPRRIDLDEARPACRERAGRARAPAGAGARRSARRRQSGLSGRARGAGRVRSGRLADRDRQQGGAGAAACPLARAGLGRTRSAWRTSGSTSTRLGCCCEAAGVELDASELSELTERTEGWPAGLYLAALSLQAGRAELGGRRELHRRRPVRVRVLPPRAPVAAAGGRGAVPQVHLGPGSHVRRAVRRRAADDAVGRHARDARAHERLRRAPRPAGRVVSLPPPVRRAAAQRARAQRAGRWWPSSTAVRWPGASPTT